MKRKDDEASFTAWVQHIFDHPGPDYVDLGESEPPAAESVGYLSRLFNDPDSILKTYSDAQISQGLTQFLYTSCTDYLRNLLDVQVAWYERQQCIRSIATLFERLFARRCGDHLFHDSASAESPLNEMCFMWWDMFPTWGKAGDQSRAAIDAEIPAVIKQILALDSVACQQSALHGLGHWQPEYPTLVAATIDEFLACKIDIAPELRQYAERARDGDVL